MDLNNSKTTLLVGCLTLTMFSYSPQVGATGGNTVYAVTQQARKITGKVTDGKDAIIGATVKQKGTNNATITDLDGNFTLSVPQGSTLEVSYIGYASKDVKISAQNSYVITLSEDNATLNEVVVVGYGSMKKSDVSGASVTMDENKLRGSIVTSLDQTLQGRAAGVTAVSTSGAPGTSTSIRVRGQATINANAEPLYVIDGVIVQGSGSSGSSFGLGDALGNGKVSTISPLSTINPNDIVSMEILKDASATAIYGSRGANGVIVIKRKTPKSGRLQFTYTGSLNIEAPDLTDYHLLNAADKLELERRAGYYDSNDPTRDFKLKKKYASILEDVARGINTDWMAKPLRTGTGHRHNIRIEGGDESFRYSASLQYNSVAGVMKGSNRDSFNGGITLSYRHHGLIFTNDLNIGHTQSNESPYGSFSDYTRLNPYWRPYDDKGNPVKMFDTDIDFYGGFSNLPANPLYNATLNQKNSQQYTDITNNFSIEWRPFEGFITRGRVGFTWRNSESDIYKPAKHTMFEADEYQTEEGSLRKGRYNYGTGKLTNYEMALTMSYSKLFSEKHLLYAAANWNVTSNFSRNYNFVFEGFTDEKLDFPSNALQYQKGGKPSGGEARTRAVGLVMNTNYSYDNRYYTDLAYRIDGSSQFGKNRRFAPFYSVGIGWKIHNASFMKDASFINKLKLRASFGQTGSQKFSAYQAVATYTYYLNDRYNQWTGAYQKALENPNLEWQKTDKWNAGVELNLFENRLNIIADIYLDKTSNLLSSLNLPLSNGFTSYVENIGKVENRGFELKATAFLLRNTSHRLVWSVTGSIVHDKDKVVKLSQAMKDEYAKRLLSRGTTPNRVIREGESQYTIYAVPSLGIDPSNGYEIFRKKNGEITYTWDANDRVACGVNRPKYRGTLSSMIRWKDFTANIAFGYRFGGQIYNSTLATRIENADKRYNVDRRVFYDRWQKVDDHTFFKGLTNETSTYATSRFVQDERTLSCQNIHLSYMFGNNPWLKRKIGIQVLTLSSDLSDLFYLSSVKQERGLSYPYSRRFSFTLSVGF